MSMYIASFSWERIGSGREGQNVGDASERWRHRRRDHVVGEPRWRRRHVSAEAERIVGQVPWAGYRNDHHQVWQVCHTYTDSFQNECHELYELVIMIVNKPATYFDTTALCFKKSFQF